MNSFKIECNENVDNYYNDVVVNSCHNDIELSNDNIYEIDGIDYFGETIEKYYTICPNCGYMVFINSDGLDESIKKNAKDTAEDVADSAEAIMDTVKEEVSELTDNDHEKK